MSHTVHLTVTIPDVPNPMAAEVLAGALANTEWVRAWSDTTAEPDQVTVTVVELVPPGHFVTLTEPPVYREVRP